MTLVFQIHFGFEILKELYLMMTQKQLRHHIVRKMMRQREYIRKNLLKYCLHNMPFLSEYIKKHYLFFNLGKNFISYSFLDGGKYFL